VAKRKPKFAVEVKPSALKGKYPTASFMADGKAVELSEDKPRFETSDELVYHGIRDLPFLNDLGDVSGEDKAEDDKPADNEDGA